MTRIATLVSLALIACGGGSAQVKDDGDGHAFDPCGSTDAAVDCSDWPSWTKINSERFESDGHTSAWVDIYTESRYADAYRALAGPMSVGFRVVKAQYKTRDAAEPSGLTVMGKMEPGYDPDHGDWFYGVYDPTGTKAIKQGKLDSCLECHDAEEATDYLSGIPEEYR